MYPVIPRPRWNLIAGVVCLASALALFPGGHPLLGAVDTVFGACNLLAWWMRAP